MTEHTLLVVLVVLLGTSTVILFALLAAVLWQIVAIVREVRIIMSRARELSEGAADDLMQLRAKIKEDGFKLRTLAEFALQRALKRFIAKKPRAKKAGKEERAEETV